MTTAHEKLARILRAQPEVIRDYADRLTAITGKTGVIEKIIEENERLVGSEITALGLTRTARAPEVYQALAAKLTTLDAKLYEYLDRPDLAKLAHVCGKLCDTAITLVNPPKGYFIKREKAIELLAANPPGNLLEHFGYANVSELIEKHGFAPVFSSLRFAQSNEWMHEFFTTAYRDLTADDFEERPVEMIVLDPEWLKVAEKFMVRKYHNVSHLKELGIIFIVPIKLDIPGETTRMFTLLLHYLNEVPFYSRLFRKFAGERDFVLKLQSLLRGDVSSEKRKTKSEKLSVRIVQRYLAKDDENDFRLLEPHINPEAEHWYKAEGDLEKLFPGGWQNLDIAGDFFGDELMSFDLIDLVMFMSKKGQVKYLYHQEEALWNKIFLEYFTRDEMNRLIEENIIGGFVEL